jgi:hypothetical protein
MAHLGWNTSIEKEIALVRGASRLQGKSWGAVITYKYTTPPFLSSGEEIFNQLRIAYEAGADYLYIFNYPAELGRPEGILSNEHFEALKRFWEEYILTKKDRGINSQAEAVLILPHNYGWGMRAPEDKIWGWWEADATSQQIWLTLFELFEKHGVLLDIVYEDPVFPVKDEYEWIYFWNGTLNNEG